MTATSQIEHELNAIIPDRDLDHLDVGHLLGVATVVDAVLVATGEIESEDPEIAERFREANEASTRGWLQRSIDEYLAIARDRELTANESALLVWSQAELDSMDAA